MTQEDNIDHNNNKIMEAKSESELWRIANNVIKPKDQSSIKLNINGKIINDEKEVAEKFNEFFVEKIALLKQDIDKTLIKDPLEKLANKMKNNKNRFSLKKISQSKLLKTMNKLKKKKSAGIDGLCQDQLILGASVLVSPLAFIINKSIITGMFPSAWKEALITPVLKKGCAETMSNYRPVSCLPAASKVLESIACEQMSNYLEKFGLLPENQHGFRPKRSTMTAWEDIQLDWAQKTEERNVTGVLLWDLSPFIVANDHS